jgi:hypothetical protein
MSKITDRMEELCAPIDKQIMMCDDREDVLMMACLMLSKCKDMFDAHLGVKGRMEIMTDAAKKP